MEHKETLALLHSATPQKNQILYGDWYSTHANLWGGSNTRDNLYSSNDVW